MASATADSSSIEANAVAAAAEARGKRPVWNVPSNGAIEVGPVMGAVSWPALSESTKASRKSSSSDSLKSLSDGLGSASATPGPLVSSPTVKPTNSIPKLHPTQNPMPPVRQKSMKRGGGGGSGSGSGSSNSNSSSGTPTNGGAGPALQPAVSTGTAQAAPDKQSAPEPSPKGSTSGGLTPQAHGGADQHRAYGGNRRVNNSHNHGNRRDQEWNHHRNAHMQHLLQRGGSGGGGGIRSYPTPPPPVSAPFLGPHPPVRPFVPNAIGFPEVPPHLYLFTQPPADPLRGMPFVPHPLPHAIFLPPMDPQRALLLKQIEYYFSYENLCRDIYLRQNMDDQGFVHISLIAGFNRVKQLTNNVQYILDTVRLSSLVEVQGERIRRQTDWMNWLLLPSNYVGSTSTPRSSDYDAVTTHFQNVNLEGANTNHNGMRGPIRAELVLTRSASGNLNNQFQVVEDPNKGDGSGQVGGFTDLDRSRSSLRSLSRSDTL